MVTRGKSINLFLMDGDPNGIIKCTIANWTGVVYKIPRTELERCIERRDLTQSGVYFLFGTSEESGEDVVYIGQAGTRKNGKGILHRLKEHKSNPDKGYWIEAVVLTTSNNSFGPTEISYLESRFCTLAQESNRYQVKNENSPPTGNATEEKKCELEEFIDYAKIVMGVSGHKLFEKFTKSKISNDPLDSIDNDELLLHLRRKSRKSGLFIEASCKQTNEGIVVLKGSLIETIDSDSIPAKIKEMRNKAKIDQNGILQEDILISSPSYAAAFVVGGYANGLTQWRRDDGKSLKEIENMDLRT